MKADDVPRQLRSVALRLEMLAEEMRANERIFDESDFDRLAALAAEVHAISDRAGAAMPARGSR